MDTRMAAGAMALAMLAALPANATTLDGVGTYEGTAGIGSANGDITASPMGSKYVYVTTAGSSFVGAGLGLANDNTGSELTTNSFTGASGEILDLYFNFVTSDGSSFVDYAYVILNNLTTGTNALLFTARTNSAAGGNTVPGEGLPPLAPGLVLTPATTPIIVGETDWSELGPESGECFGAGCGQTGWVQAVYALSANSTYSLTFGVVNWDDEILASGLAVASARVGDRVIFDPNLAVVPLPSAGVLMAGAIVLLAAAGRRRRTV